MSRWTVGAAIVAALAAAPAIRAERPPAAEPTGARIESRSSAERQVVDIRRYAWESALEVGSGAGEYAATIAVDVLVRARGDLADLRVVDPHGTALAHRVEASIAADWIQLEVRRARPPERTGLGVHVFDLPAALESVSGVAVSALELGVAEPLTPRQAFVTAPVTGGRRVVFAGQLASTPGEATVLLPLSGVPVRQLALEAEPQTSHGPPA